VQRRAVPGNTELVGHAHVAAELGLRVDPRLVGTEANSPELPDGAPIEALFAHYGASYPELARFRASLVASRNQEFAAWNTPLHSGDEVAFLPPVSGG